MERSPWEADSHKGNARVLCHLHKSPALVHVLGQTHPVHNSHHMSLRSILLLSSHIRLGYPSCLFLSLSRYSVGWRTGWSGFQRSIPGEGWEFFSSLPRPERLWGPPSLIQWVSGALSVGVKRPGCESNHSLPCSAEVKESVELYLHSPICLHGAVLSCSTRTTLPFTFYEFLLATMRAACTTNLIVPD
jgi:hypothetical protein